MGRPQLAFVGGDVAEETDRADVLATSSGTFTGGFGGSGTFFDAFGAFTTTFSGSMTLQLTVDTQTGAVSGSVQVSGVADDGEGPFGFSGAGSVAGTLPSLAFISSDGFVTGTFTGTIDTASNTVNGSIGFSLAGISGSGSAGVTLSGSLVSDEPVPPPVSEPAALPENWSDGASGAAARQGITVDGESLVDAGLTVTRDQLLATLKSELQDVGESLLATAGVPLQFIETVKNVADFQQFYQSLTTNLAGGILGILPVMVSRLGSASLSEEGIFEGQSGLLQLMEETFQASRNKAVEAFGFSLDSDPGNVRATQDFFSNFILTASVTKTGTNQGEIAFAVQSAVPEATGAFGGVSGTDSTELIFAGGSNDTIRLFGGDDAAFGGGGNDTVFVEGGAKLIDGGDGLDVAVVSSARGGAQIALTAASSGQGDEGPPIGLATPNGRAVVTLSHENAVVTHASGSATLAEVERVRFTDGTLALDTDGTAGQGYRLYQAAFARTPDTPGLSHNVTLMDGGLTLKQMSNAFIASAEFMQLYGQNPSNAEFITLLYNNVLGRGPDPLGFAGWNEFLVTGALDRADVLIGFSESPENISLVGTAIEDGIWLG